MLAQLRKCALCRFRKTITTEVLTSRLLLYFQKLYLEIPFKNYYSKKTFLALFYPGIPSLHATVLDCNLSEVVVLLGIMHKAVVLEYVVSSLQQQKS